MKIINKVLLIIIILILVFYFNDINNILLLCGVLGSIYFLKDNNSIIKNETIGNNEVEKIDDYYILEKEISLKFDKNKKSNVWFLFEKLTDKNIEFWKEYYADQELKTRRIGVNTTSETKKIEDNKLFSEKYNINENILNTDEFKNAVANKNKNYIRGINNRLTDNEIDELFANYISLGKKQFKIKDGIGSFNDSLKWYNNSFYDTWICSANTKKPDLLNRSANFYPYIEMVVSVLMNKPGDNIPISSHIGIFKNYLYFKEENNPHNNLSVYLHSFAAKASLIIYPYLCFMVTKPITEMLEILKKHVPLYFGDMYDRNELKNKLIKYDEDKKYIQDNKDILNEKIYKSIKQLNYNAPDYIDLDNYINNFYYEYLESILNYDLHESYGKIKCDNKNGIFCITNKNIVYLVDSGFIDRSILYEFNSYRTFRQGIVNIINAQPRQDEETVKENIEKYYNDNKEKLIDEFRKELTEYCYNIALNDIENSNNYYKEFINKYYPNLYEEVPYNNIDDNKNFVIYNNKKIEYKAPPWIRGEYSRHDLNYLSIPTTIIDINILSNYINNN
jgi:hypothetical protein